MSSIMRKIGWCPEQGDSGANPHGCSLLGGAQIVLLAALLTGCATPPATVEVKVPVYVPCAKPVPRPAFEFPALPDDASDGQKVVAMARDTLLHFKYEAQLEAALAGCL